MRSSLQDLLRLLMHSSHYSTVLFNVPVYLGGPTIDAFVTMVIFTGPNFKTTSCTQMFPGQWIIWQSRLVPGIKPSTAQFGHIVGSRGMYATRTINE